MYDESEQYTQRQFKRRKKVYYKTENAVRYKVYQRRRKGIVIQRYQVKFRSIGNRPQPTNQAAFVVPSPPQANLLSPREGCMSIAA
jgi:hypothetical protein